MNILRSNFIVWAGVIIAIFSVISTFVESTMLLVILNGIFLGISTAAVIVYFPVISFALNRNNFDRVTLLAIGISLLWFSMMGQKVYSIIWQANGSPSDWHSNPFLVILAFMAIIAGALFVTAPGYPPSEDKLPSVSPMLGENRYLLFFLGGVGGIAALILSIYFK